MAKQAQDDYAKWLAEEPARREYLNRLKFEQNKRRVDAAFKVFLKDKRPQHVDNQWSFPE